MSFQPQTGLDAQQILQTVYSPTTNTIRTAPPVGFIKNHVPTTATQATVTQASAGTGLKNYCTAIIACVSCGANDQTPIQVYLRDGATGAGTILFAATLAAPAKGSDKIVLSGLNIAGSAATAMTLEFSAAGVTASQETVTLIGYAGE